MKVAWICHFYNDEIQNILHPSVKRSEMAAWMPMFAKLFEGEGTIELHIIAPDNFIAGYKTLILRGITYHFYNPNLYLFGYDLLGFFNINDRIGYFFSKRYVSHIIKKIKPDIIHLFGAENAYYSASILSFKRKYPVLITIQGFISKATAPHDKAIRKRIEVEKKILRSFNNIAYCAEAICDDILEINPNAKLHYHEYPVPEILPIESDKKFDIVFFARICKDKGVDDLLTAISKIKQKLPNISICMIGTSSNYYRKMVYSLGISENVHWTGYLPTLKDVHTLASKAKISVLPTYHDTIPGTIIESMFLKLPVVAYSTGGIPEINDKMEYLDLVEVGDIDSLAERIYWLLQNPELMKEKSELAYNRAREMFSNGKIKDDIISAYNIILDDFNTRYH